MVSGFRLPPQDVLEAHKMFFFSTNKICAISWSKRRIRDLDWLLNFSDVPLDFFSKRHSSGRHKLWKVASLERSGAWGSTEKIWCESMVFFSFLPWWKHEWFDLIYIYFYLDLATIFIYWYYPAGTFIDIMISASATCSGLGRTDEASGSSRSGGFLFGPQNIATPLVHLT